MIVVLPRPVTLGSDEFDLLWRRLRLGDKPVLLHDVQSGVPTLDELSRVDAQAADRLRRRGLLVGEDAEPGLEDVLRALAAPAVQVDIRIWTAPGRLRFALGCLAGDIAVVATAADRVVHLVPADTRLLASGLLQHLPDHPAVAGRPFTVPAHLVDRERLTAATSQAVLEDAGLSVSTIQQIRRLLAGNTVLQASIGTAARDGTGVLRRAPLVIAVLDTDSGRMMIRRRADLVTVTPATREQIASEVDEFNVDHRRSLSTVN